MPRDWRTDPTLDDLRNAELLLAQAASRLGPGAMAAKEAATLCERARHLRLGLKHAITKGETSWSAT